MSFWSVQEYFYFIASNMDVGRHCVYSDYAGDPCVKSQTKIIYQDFLLTNGSCQIT